MHAIHDQAPDPLQEPAPLDVGQQELPPTAAPIAAEEVAEVRAEFAQRVTVAPQVEEALHARPAGMVVRSGERTWWRAVTGLVKKVW